MKFSIIVPVYNTEDFLAECLDSMMNQTEQSWECLCIDDGSSDSSGKICDEYARRDSRFKVIHQTNRGLTATRNVGLRLAQGDYVGFLDCDDARQHDWLEAADVVIGKTRADMIRMESVVWHGEKNAYRTEKSSSYGIEAIYEADEVFRWGWKTFSRNSYVWLYFVRRDLLVDFQFVERRIYREDMISSMLILERVKSVAQIDYAGCLYRERIGSMMHSRISGDELLGYWQEYRKILERCKQQMLRLQMWDGALNVFTLAVLGSVRNWLVLRGKEDTSRRREIADTARMFYKEEMLKKIDGIWGFLFECYCKRGFEWPLSFFSRFAIKAVSIRKRIMGR